MSFTQFLREDQYQYLFHGTSSVFKAGILKHGLLPGEHEFKQSEQEAVYLATNFGLAVREAKFTCEGENGEEGAGGSPVVVVVDRKKVKGLRRDHEYHRYDKLKSGRAFWTPNSVPISAIISIVKPDDPRYSKANQTKLAKQIGLFDSEGNVIVTNNGESPKRDNKGDIIVYFKGNKPPSQFDYWSTNEDSEYYNDSKHVWVLTGRSEMFEIVDQLADEVLLKPNRSLLKKMSKLR